VPEPVEHHGHVGQAEVALETFGPPYVVKNDGLAAGKGVVVTDDYDEALAHAVHCGRVVIEEYLDGPEVSLFVVTDAELLIDCPSTSVPPLTVVPPV
jgi:phosphoribosylamine--glycine ligase